MLTKKILHNSNIRIHHFLQFADSSILCKEFQEKVKNKYLHEHRLQCSR